MSMPTNRRLRASPHDGRAPPAAGRRQAAGLDQADLGQPVELDRELGPGQLDGLTELGPAHRAAVAQQAQQRAWCLFSGRTATRLIADVLVQPLPGTRAASG